LRLDDAITGFLPLLAQPRAELWTYVWAYLRGYFDVSLWSGCLFSL
jgi:hypothetical protein